MAAKKVKKAQTKSMSKGKSAKNGQSKEFRQAGAANISAGESMSKGKSPSASTRGATSAKRFRAAESKYGEAKQTSADYVAMFRTAGVYAPSVFPKKNPRRGTR